MIDICKHIPCCNGFYVINKLNDSPNEMVFYKNPFVQNNIGWFLNKIINIEIHMREIFELNRKPKKTTKSDKLFLKTNICWLYDEDFRDMDDKVKHYFKLSGNYLGVAHQSCFDYVNKTDQHNYFPVLYHHFSKHDNHMVFNDLFNSKVDKIELSVIPSTNEQYICVKYGCVKFLDSLRFKQNILEKLTESLSDQDYIHLKQHFPNHWMLIRKKLAYPFQFYKTLEHYEKPIEDLIKSGKEDYFSKVEIL